MIRILNCFKTTPDLDQVPEADWLSGASAGAFDFYGIKSEIDPCSECALEMTLQATDSVREAVELTALTIGQEVSEKGLRTLFALGFDAGVRIDGNPDPFCPEQTAHLIKDYCISNQSFDLIVMGDLSADGNNRKTQFLLTEYLGYPIAQRVLEFSFTDDNRVRIKREIPGGFCEETRALPLIISVGDVPGMLLRVPTLMQRKKASEKQIQRISYEGTSIDEEASITLTALEYLDQSRSGEVIHADSPAHAAQILHDRYLRGLKK
ncbi:MAG: hypothetical protein IJH05_00385 [Firmicutes bacterium]|nr:hypothetical protein [Bacillota bacterium]